MQTRHPARGPADILTEFGADDPQVKANNVPAELVGVASLRVGCRAGGRDGRSQPQLLLERPALGVRRRGGFWWATSWAAARANHEATLGRSVSLARGGSARPPPGHEEAFPRHAEDARGQGDSAHSGQLLVGGLVSGHGPPKSDLKTGRRRNTRERRKRAKHGKQ